jgi:hypothetical protein
MVLTIWQIVTIAPEVKDGLDNDCNEVVDDVLRQ